MLSDLQSYQVCALGNDSFSDIYLITSKIVRLMENVHLYMKRAFRVSLRLLETVFAPINIWIETQRKTLACLILKTPS